eukprot:scaffold961_cov83-Skeletonema_dohrnii-CCMP3373.AAC.5
MASHGKLLPQSPRDPTNHSDELGHEWGVDMAFNTQPESMGGMWNVRGLVNNSYYRVKHKVM